MKRLFRGILFTFFMPWSAAAFALPLDLSGFTAEPGSSESGGVVSFVEDINYASIYFY